MNANSWFFILLITPTLVLAHDPGISNATVSLGGERIVIRLQYARADLETLALEGSAGHSLHDLAARAVEWRTSSGPAPLTVRSALASDDTTTEFVLEGPAEPGDFRSSLIAELPPGHKQVLVVRDHADTSMRIHMLSSKHPTETISQADLAKAKSPEPTTKAPSTPPAPASLWLAVLALLPLLFIFWR